MISVIIPTLNRCTVLPEAVRSIREQSISDEQYEIIVVDNGSSDSTGPVVEHLNGRTGKSIRYIWEPRRGLHWARHAGVRAAEGEVLAFTDDDAVATPGWLGSLIKAYADPRVGAAGGPIQVRWKTPP